MVRVAWRGGVRFVRLQGGLADEDTYGDIEVLLWFFFVEL